MKYERNSEYMFIFKNSILSILPLQTSKTTCFRCDVSDIRIQDFSQISFQKKQENSYRLTDHFSFTYERYFSLS